jgi:hypothetical protein
MQQGLKLLETVRESLIMNKRRPWYAITEHILGEIYAQIATGLKPSLSVIVKNIGFLIKHVPFAAQKAKQSKQSLLEAIKIFEECEADTYLQQANELLASLS